MEEKMNYLKALNLGCEPFATTPDPEFFYRTTQHYGCLQKLEISVRLKRGLNVVVGEVGSGKTTLCREILRRLARDKEVETHLIMDPSFENPTQFVAHVAEMFFNQRPGPGTSDWQIKEDIKHYLFQQCVEKGRTIVVLIDEGQKTPKFCLEILREFLNYETNNSKLLQIIIMAQPEFQNQLRDLPNFADRIALYYDLKPLSFWDTQAMIQHRLDKARLSPEPIRLFTRPALWAIYRHSSGFPRKIINLCHLCLLTALIEKKTKVDYFIVQACHHQTGLSRHRQWRRPAVLATLTSLLLVLIVFGLQPAKITAWLAETPQKLAKQLSTAQVEAPLIQTTHRENVQQPLPEKITSVVTPPTPPAGTGNEPIVSPGRSDPTPAPSLAPDTTPPSAVGQNTDREKDKSPELPPEILGSLTIQPKETLTYLIQKVYGGLKMSYIDKILQVNPQVSDMENIQAGQVLRFPAIARKVVPHPDHLWGVEISRSKNLAEAMKVLKSYPPEAVPIRMISSWNKKGGLRFQVIMRETFAKESLAREAMNQLPPDSQIKARAVNLWSDETIYYADPFALVHTKVAER